jgi:hypothetical protein
MANTLRFKRGLAAGIPTGVAGEPLFTTDTFDLYIGNGTTNTRFQKYIASGTTAQYLRGDGSLATFPTDIVTGTGVSGQVAYWSGTNTQVGSNNFIWDNANNRLNIGTSGSNGSYTLTVRSAASCVAALKGGTSTNQGSAFYIINANNTASLTAFGDESSIIGGTPDLSAMIFTNTSIPLKFYISGAERMRLTSNGRLLLGTTTEGTQLLQVNGTSYFADNIGLGVSHSAARLINIGKNISGAVTSYGSIILSNVQSDVTNSARVYYSEVGTAAASFTLPDLNHFWAVQGTFGAGSSVTNQYGYRVYENLTGATNNYGFYGNIASGTGRWNLYMNGTALNYLNGNLGVGALPNAYTGINLAKPLTGLSLAFGVVSSGTIQSDVTSAAYYYETGAKTQAAAFTIGQIIHYNAIQGTFGAGSTVTSQFGFFADASLIGATNDYGFFGNIASGTGRWNLYMNGSAANFLAGQLSIGTTATNLGYLTNYATIPVLALQNPTTGTATSDGFQLSVSGSLAYVWQYENSSILFGTNATERMRLTNLGNLHLGTFSSDSGELLQVNGTMKVTGASTFARITATTSSIILDYNSGILYHFGGSGDYYQYISGADYRIANRTPTGSLNFATNDTNRLTIASTGAATFSSSVTAGGNLLLTAGTASSIGAINLIRTGTSPVASRLTFGTDGTGYSFAIGKNQSGTVTDLFSILDSGAANFTTSIQAGTAIAIGTTPDTNKPFKILKNINATVGINFENTSTSSLAFSAIQMGTDVTGGTAFTNLVYGSSGISEAGVYKPSGTSLVNTGSGGLNFLAVSQPIRFFTSSGNGTLRASITNDGDYTQFNGTNPSASTTDAFRMYSADVVAGNAAPHFRTENGAVIKLYQETTGVGNAIFSAGGGNSVLDDSTFDGYTIRQIVKALRNQGILA